MNLFSHNNNKNKKIAIIIGTNYINTDLELKGCNNDTKMIYNLLINFFKYKKENIILINDTTDTTNTTDTNNTKKYPTKKNIISIFDNIVKESNITTLFFYFSGHGNNNGIFINSYEILDKYEFKNNFLNKLSRNTKLIIILDCCRSGNYIDSSFISNINSYLLNLKIIFLAACNNFQNTSEIYDKSNNLYYGIFTYCLYSIINKYNPKSWSQLIYLIKIIIYKTQQPILKTINYSVSKNIIKY